MMGIYIRRALPENAFDYAVNHIACWRAAYKEILSDEYLINMNVEQITEANLRVLSDPDVYKCYYVENNGNMVGRLVINRSRDEDKADAGEISAMYLLSEYWGKGYGREMMSFSLYELKRMGHDEVLLWVLEANVRARMFYEKCGFTLDGTQKEINIDTLHNNMRYIRTL